MDGYREAPQRRREGSLGGPSEEKGLSASGRGQLADERWQQTGRAGLRHTRLTVL